MAAVFLLPVLLSHLHVCAVNNLLVGYRLQRGYDWSIIPMCYIIHFSTKAQQCEP